MLGEEVQEYTLSSSSTQYCNHPRSLWLGDSGHFYNSAALWKPMQSSRITEAVRLLSHSSRVRSSWELPNANNKPECRRTPLPKTYRSNAVATPVRQPAGAQSTDFKHIRVLSEELVEVPAVITTCGTTSSSEQDAILALQLPWSF